MRPVLFLRRKKKDDHELFMDRDDHCRDGHCPVDPRIDSVYAEPDPQGTEGNPEEKGQERILRRPGPVQKEGLG